jgi:hypothetical protein
MADIVLIKTAGGALIPADPQAAEFIAKMKLGAGVSAAVKKHRNPRFHRKYFALLNLAYESWEPADKEFRGLAVQKNFDRFRKDVIIAAGWYDVVVNINGDVRAEAKSINFSSMDDSEFADLYSKTVDVVLHRFLTNYSRDDLDSVVDQIMSFA